MFGFFRTLLALAVVLEHLGPAHYIGPYAVFGFYVLSGYLMTLIVHETYGYTARGVLRYAINRWLRIFPIYYLAALISLVLVTLLGEPLTRSFHENIGLPSTMNEVARNVGLLLSIHTDTRLVPPAWALSVECAYYLMIGLGISKHFVTTMIWLLGSVLYTAYLVSGDASFSYRYYTIAAASLPFAMGAAIYHLKSRMLLPMRLLGGNRALLVLVSAVAANYLFAITGNTKAAVTLHFYANMAIMALLIIQLSGRASGKLRQLDSIVGDLSYPIYLIHFQAGLIVITLVPSLARGSIEFLLLALPVVLALAWSLSRLVEAPIDSLRSAIRRVAKA
ncbi:MAG: acyltransferase [Azoarcus sp.]|nr:acyltransferase [Azoarcus sp.]